MTVEVRLRTFDESNASTKMRVFPNLQCRTAFALEKIVVAVVVPVLGTSSSSSNSTWLLFGGGGTALVCVS